MPNFSQTAIGCIEISDSLTDLMADCYLPADVHLAAQSFPSFFQFNPIKDSEFYDNRYWWRQSHEAYVAGAQKVLARFHRWYPRASSMERVLLSIAALTDTSEQIDNIIHDALVFMRNQHQVIFLDVDDTIYHIEDYHAMRDEANIDAALFTRRVSWWCRQIEHQVGRVIAAPPVPFDDFKKWHTQHANELHRLTCQFRRKQPTHDRSIKRQSRRLLNRSLTMFSKFFGESAARNFIHGKNLWIRGEHFVWKLKVSPRNIMNFTINPVATHTPFRISICDQKLNRLADACVLFDNTPVMEQAIAIKVWVADDEIALLTKTNIFSFSEAGRNNDFLKSFPHADVVPPVREEDRPLDDPSIDDGLDPDHQSAFIQEHEYYERDAVDMEHVFDPDDPFNNAFRCEEPMEALEAFLPFYTSHDPERHVEMVRLYQEWMDRSRYERWMRAMNPTARRMREKLIVHLSALSPDILHYMQFPEFHYHFIHKVKKAPRLEDYVSGYDSSLRGIKS